MFLLDDLLLAPGKAAFYLVSQLAKQAEDEFLDDKPIKDQLRACYMLLESGRITEEEFSARETELVARLEQIAMMKGGMS